VLSFLYLPMMILIDRLSSFLASGTFPGKYIHVLLDLHERRL
jgi:hypothetical protein